MYTVTAYELLDCWERNLNQSLLKKAIDLLCIAYPEMKAEDIAGLCIGERDARLLRLREWLFGSLLHSSAECPECSERNEWETNIKDIRMQILNPEKPREIFLLEKDGYSIQFRLPNSNHISECMEVNDEERLLKSLILDCKFENKHHGIIALPDTVLDALDCMIEEEDPMADIIMNVKCVSCSHEWEVQFDIVSYLWTEINSWARHLLLDVGKLAHAYGWSEQDILSMSPVRRQIYLDMMDS